MLVDLVWLGPLGSIPRWQKPPSPVRHVLDVKGGQCVHSYYSLEKGRVQCINAAVKTRKHGFLCRDHTLVARAPYVSNRAWTDYDLDATFVAAYDRKIIDAERRKVSETITV